MPGEPHTLRRPLAEEFDIGDERLHLADRPPAQFLAVHAADHAAIDALLQCDAPCRRPSWENWHRSKRRELRRASARIEMAVHACQIVSGIAVLWIGRALADMRRRIDDQRMAFADEIVGRAGREVGDIARIPIGRPAPYDVSGAKSRCQGGNAARSQPSSHDTSWSYYPLIRGATAAKSITLSSSRLGRAHPRCTTTQPR